MSRMYWELSLKSKSKWRPWSSSPDDELTIPQILCRQMNGPIGKCFQCDHVDLPHCPSWSCSVKVIVYLLAACRI
jgi:hypothetical protein